jgi:hypothetical protein
MGRRAVILVLVVEALIAASAAPAEPGMLVGAREDGLKWRTGPTVAVARDLGLGAIGITLDWQPGMTDIGPTDLTALNGTVVGAAGMRVVAAVFGGETGSPIDASLREQYCTYVGNLIKRFPQINDLVIWNEPNLTAFWRPQFRNGVSDAPARYTELLARCYDVLHGIRPSVNIVAPATSLWGNDNPNALSNISHSPTAFIRAMGIAYRQSGRTRPIFDTLGHHPYPARSDERPWAAHPEDWIISIGDLGRLVGVLHEAFDGTGQPQPGNGLPIWYLETGYQTQIDSDKTGLYGGVETWPGSLPDLLPGAPSAKPPDLSPAPDQASQLADSVRLTYCQPYVSAVFNFLLRDERDLAGWQSGVLWADGSGKDSYGPFRNVVREVNERRVDCGELLAGATIAGASGQKPPGSTGSAKAPGATRSLTKVSFRGRARMPYGFLSLGAQLTRGLRKTDRGLDGKQLLFVVAKTGYVTTTNKSGFARLTPMPPMNPGRQKVQISFSGDELNQGSGLRLRVQVTNSKARVQSQGVIRLGSALSGRLEAQSNGTRVRGTMTFRDRGKLRSVRLISLGVDGARAAWLRGRSGPDRYVINLERLRGKRLVRVRVWRNGAPVGAPATVPTRKLRIAPR